MPKSAVWLRGIAALVGTMIVIAIPLSAQARCANGSKYCNHPVVGSRVSTVYRYKTVPEVRNVNRYHDVTRTSYHDIMKTKYYDVHRIKYEDVTRTNYVRHINRIVTVTRVQPVVRVHMATRVHHQVIARVHTRVIPRVHVSVIPRVHTRTVVLRENQYASETKILPTRTVMAGSRTISAGMRTTRIAGNGMLRPLYNVVPRSAPWRRPVSGHHGEN